MPILTGCCHGNPYVRYEGGTKFYYDKTDLDSYHEALDKAHRQGMRIEAEKAKRKRQKRKSYLF
jgi:hypothetical protein